MLGLAARLSRLGALLALSTMGFAASAAQLVVVLDTDHNAATGCTVTTPSGTFTGAEVVLTTTVNTATNPPTVGAVTQQTCVGAVLGAPVPVSPGGWNVGVGLGVAGYDVIETFVPVATPPAVYRVGAYYTDVAGTDVLFTVGGAPGGGPIVLALPGAPSTQVPTLSDAGIFLLALLLCVAAARSLHKRRLPTTLVVGLFAVILTSAALAAMILDGQISDWAGTPPLSTDALNDSPGGTDISALFARVQNNNIYFRADVKTAALPSAVADTYSTTINTPLTIAASGLLANDTLGLPAATVTSFGGGGAGGTATTNAAGATATFGVGGSLTVNANGSFTYTPVTGFTGAFTFSYVITNPSGNSTGLVTINTNQSPTITSANATTFVVGVAGTFSVTTTGFPKPAVSVTGCALPSNVTFVDNGNGTGTLAGTPATGTSGTYSCTVNANNGVGAPAAQAFTLTVNQKPAITSANSATFTVGSLGTFTVTTTGFPTGASMSITETGALPGGVTFTNNNDGTATLTGTPGAGTGGSYSLTITANNGVAPNATQTFTLAVNQAPAITSGNAATFSVGVPNTFPVTASGFPAPALGFGGCAPALPASVTFLDNGNGTGTLSGNPASGQVGTFACTVSANNSVGAPATQPFTLTIQEVPIAVSDAYSVTHDSTLIVPAASGLLANDTGTPAPTVVQVTGTGPACTVFACTITTTNGSAVVAADGSFTYTPTALFAGTDTFTYAAGNVVGTSAPATVTITVNNAAPVVDLNGPAAGIGFGPVGFTEGAAAAAIVDPAQLTVIDTDSPNLASATVTITNPLDQPNETIGYSCPAVAPACSGAIQVTDVSYTPATGTLVITSNAPLADYQALLRTLTYTNASDNPTTTPRVITAAVNDGIATSSPVAQVTVNLTATDDAPTITAPVSAVTNTNTAHTFPGNVSVADVDAGTSAVKVTLTSTNGTATLSGTAGLAVTGNGSATVVATGPLTSQNAALNNMQFTPTPAFSGAASLKIDIDDQGNTGTGGPLTATKTVAITVDNAPTVTSTVPTNGASSIGLNATVTVNFSEAVTVTGSAFTLNCPAAQAFTVSPASPASSFTLTPTSPLPAGAACTLTVVAAQVTDSVAQNMAADFVASFSTDTLPTVLSTTPTNGATAVAPGSTITVNFSESVNATTASFSIACPGAQPFTLSSSPSSSFVLTPSSALPSGATCTVTALAAQITDVDAGQNMAANFPFSFQTATPAVFTSANSTKFTEGASGSFNVVTTGGNPTPILTRTGTLPSGVTFTDNLNGTATLAGTPGAGTSVGSPYAQIFTATNAAGAPTQSFNLFVCPVISATPGTIATPTTTNNYSQTLAGSGGTGPYTFAVTGGALPAGMTLSPAGLLSATPVTGSGAFSFTVTVTDSAGCTGTATYTGTVNAPPVVGTDSYETVGNTLLEVAGASVAAGPKIFVSGNVLANDNDGDGGANGVGVTVAATGAFATTHGSITIASDGTFTYLPAAGYTGTDSFGYTVSDGTGTAIGTINFNVVAHLVWYVKNDGAAGDGRSSSPFNTLAAAVTASATNDTIFVFTGDGLTTNQNAGAVLKNGQRLVGEGAALDVPVTVNAVATPTLYPAGGAPRIGNSAGNGVTLASANTLKGFIAATASGTAILGTNVGALVISTLAVSTGGAGIDLTGAGVPSVNVVIMSVSSNGGTKNVNLVGLGGTIDLGTGNLAGATGNAFDVSGAGGTANISYAGTIDNASTGARAVSVTGKTAGTVALSGAITSSGTNPAGIFLNSNTGATINLSGTLTLTTGTNPAFTATGGGTVTATGTGSVLTATTATALNVANTTIGAGGLNFQSISSSGGSSSGIILDTTGATAGLTVNGDGANTTVGGNFSGGTITNKSGADFATTSGIGIYLNNTKNVVLRRMRINGTNQNYGIRGNQVNGFTLEYSTVNGTNGTAATLAAPENAGEGSIYFGNTTTNGLLTSGTFTSNVIGGGRANNLSIINTTGTTTLSITNNNFQLNQNFSDANQALLVEAWNGGTTVNSTVTGNTFAGAPGDDVNFTGQTGTTMSVTMSGNTLANTHAQNIIGGGGLTLATQGTMNFDVQNNALSGADGSAVTLQLASAGTLLSGKFSNNTIGVAAILNSGSKSGNGIFGSFAGAGTASLTITNNLIHQYAGNAGMFFDNTGGSYTANFTIASNTVDTPGPLAFAGLAITNGAPSSTDTVHVCADIKSNDMSTGDPNNAADIIVGASGAAAGHAFNLPGYIGTTVGQVQTFILGNNNVAGTVVTAYTDPPVIDTAFTGTGLSCPTPP
jgi:hypothetical protein